MTRPFPAQGTFESFGLVCRHMLEGDTDRLSLRVLVYNDAGAAVAEDARQMATGSSAGTLYAARERLATRLISAHLAGRSAAAWVA